MKFSVDMTHAEDLASLAILAQALNEARHHSCTIVGINHIWISECKIGAIYANRLLEHFRERQKYFEGEGA